MAARKKAAVSNSNMSEAEAKERQMAQAARDFIKKNMSLAPVEFDLRTPFIPSGSILLDQAIGGHLAADGSGPVCPGFPRRRIIEVYGPEASGKTTATLHAIAEAQKAGGRCMFLDFEHALDVNYAKKLGVNFDPDWLLFLRPSTIEEGFKLMSVAIRSGYDLVVIDSVPALITKAELEKSLDENDKIGSIALVMSSKLRKLINWLSTDNSNPRGGTSVVFINQVRESIGGGGKGPEEKTPGGRALKFFSSLRLRFGSIGSAYVKKKTATGKEISMPYGAHTRIKVVKNKMSATNGQSVDIFIRHGEGYDNALTLIETGIFYKAIKKSGAWLVLDGQQHQGKDKLRKFLLANPDAMAKLRDVLLTAVHSQATAAASEDEPEVEEVDAATAHVRLLEKSMAEDGDDDSSDEDDESSEDDEEFGEEPGSDD